MKQSTLLLRACEIWIKKTSKLVLKGARDALGSSDPVPIACDCGGVPGSSDPVSTAARRGDGSHCDDGLFSPARRSLTTSSGCAELFRVLGVVQEADTLSSGSFSEMPEISPYVP